MTTLKPEPKTEKLEKYTVVRDDDENRVLFHIEGVVVLPVGTDVELSDGQSATVARVRLLTPVGPGEPVTVCLDVTRFGVLARPKQA